MCDLVEATFAQFEKREACHFNGGNTLSWVFFTHFKLYKLYQIVQSIAFAFLHSCKISLRLRLNVARGSSHVRSLLGVLWVWLGILIWGDRLTLLLVYFRQDGSGVGFLAGDWILGCSLGISFPFTRIP